MTGPRSAAMWPASRSISTSVPGSPAAAAASSSSATARAGQAGQPARLGRLGQQPRPPLAVGGQPPGPLEGGRRGRVGAAVPAAGGGLGQRRRRGLVRPGRRRGQMPGPAVDVPVGQRGGQRPVRVPPLAGRRVGVDRRPGQRMAELHRARAQRDQPGALGRGQRRPGRCRAGPPPAGARPGRRCRWWRPAPGPAGRPGPAGPPGAGTRRDPGRHQHRGTFGGQHQRPAASAASSSSASGLPAVAWCSRGDRVRRQAGHQPGRLVAGQPAEPEHRQVGAVEQGRLALAHRDQDRDRVGHQPAEREQQRLRARSVEPLGVVDQHRHRLLLGVGGEQAERRRAHREPVLGRARPQRQRAFQRRRLRRRDLVQQRQRRADQLQQRPERDLRLGLDAPRPQQPHAVRARRRRSPAARVLPMPGSPDSASAALAPERACASACSISRRSCSRPSSMARL